MPGFFYARPPELLPAAGRAGRAAAGTLAPAELLRAPTRPPRPRRAAVELAELLPAVAELLPAVAELLPAVAELAADGARLRRRPAAGRRPPARPGPG